MSGSCRDAVSDVQESLPVVQEWSGDPPGCLGVVGGPPGCPGGPIGCPGVVGRPSWKFGRPAWKFGRPSQMSGSSRETLLDVPEG